MFPIDFDSLFGGTNIFQEIRASRLLLELEQLKQKDPASFTAQVVQRALEAARHPGSFEAAFWKRYLGRLTGRSS